MLERVESTVIAIVETRPGVQEIETQHGAAINYVHLTGGVVMGDRVLLNRTARRLGLGTGGYDFVMAVISGGAANREPVAAASGHIIKVRYTPVQHAVHTLEENPAYEDCWERELYAFPVVVGQLHSQIAPIAAALALHGRKSAYVMTDGAALPIGLSRLADRLKEAGLIAMSITAGQAFGGDYETVTVHSALLAAAHILACDAAIVCQGPGNAGTGTPYGFSGIEQANLLDTAAALGGTPIAVARISESDTRERHRGISHHTLTSLRLVRSRCLVALPEGIDAAGLDKRHDIRHPAGAGEALRFLAEHGIEATTMGRGVDEDRVFFEAAEGAGMLAAQIADERTHTKGRP